MHFNSKFNRMTDNRMSSIAFFVGMTGTIITMALHPTSQDVASPGNAGHMMQLNVAVHSLALVCIPILFLGALGLTHRLAAPNRLALSALVMFGFADVAVMIAAAASGLIAPGLFHHMAANPGMAEAWRAVLILNGHLNQAFAMIFVVASSAAIVLWSAAILRSAGFSRLLGIYGCIIGPLTVIAVISGHIRLNVHGFGIVVLVQAVWFISAGVLLWKEDQPPAQLTSA
jgi:hypothetical protein